MTWESRLQIVRLVDDALAVAGREVGAFVSASARTPTDYGSDWLESDFGNYLFVSEDVLARVQAPPQRALVENQDLLPAFRAAWQASAPQHRAFLILMLGPASDALDDELSARGLQGDGLALKQAGFDAAMQEYLAATSWLRRRKWFRGLLRWADIVLGSLGSIPALGAVLDPVKEWKEAVEAQVDTETGRRRKQEDKRKPRR